MKQEGINQESIQSMNRALILRFLQQNRMCSRVQLAQLSGLKQATITNIVNDFISWGIVEEMGLIDGSKGRRAIAIRLENEHFAVIGVRVARKYYEVGLFSLRGEPAGEKLHVKITNTDPDFLLPVICNDITAMISANRGRHILAVGVAVPGPYYYREGRIEDVFPGWESFSVSNELQKRLPLPVIVEHDANAGALAEYMLIPGNAKYETLVYLAVGQGIGAGILSRGSLFRGTGGIAGEIGHISINLEGPVCTCGNRGCLTAYASTIAFTNRINRVRRKTDPTLPELTYEQLTLPQNRKDPVVEEEFNRNMRYLSVGINNLIYTYNPDLIIIGDEISSFGSAVTSEVERNLVYLARHTAQERVQIRPSSFPMDSAFVGAAEVAINYVFHNVSLLQE